MSCMPYDRALDRDLRCACPSAGAAVGQWVRLAVPAVDEEFQMLLLLEDGYCTFEREENIFFVIEPENEVDGSYLLPDRQRCVECAWHA